MIIRLTGEPAETYNDRDRSMEVCHMYLKRKIDSFLDAWKADPERKPLIVKGARQIGKTESIRQFSAGRYISLIEINFALEPKYKTITEEGYEVESIVRHITLLDPSKEFLPGETLIFFDELQEFPEIATALKAFCQDRRYDVICSGSLLGVHYRRIQSISVGYKNDYEMYSLDFEEYLWAKGYKEETVQNMLHHMTQLVPFSESELTVYRRLFLDYCVLGGMPGVVRSYIEKGNFSGSLSLQRQLLLDYEEDVRKYAEGLDQAKILSVYRHIPTQLAKENKKFQYSTISRSARAREYQGCIEWLQDAGVVSICYCLHFPELPLKGNYDEAKFKLYYTDTGLLVASLDEEAQEDLRANKNLGVYKGALYENLVAEALVKQGLGLYYYKREDSQLEEDFFVRTAYELLPVEVKAGNNNSKSLSTLIRSEKYTDVKCGVKLSAGNIGFSNGIFSFPYFCAFLLKKWLDQLGHSERNEEIKQRGNST